jgi:diketogulonate reductase-like aldo/keto reductase
MPQLGFGVFKIPPAACAATVAQALALGYRSIDTAAAYQNEEGVGRAVADSGIPREELFITSKIWNADQGYDSTLRALDASLDRLGLAYLDLYLIHWPMPERGLYLETWRALESQYRAGRIKAIGLSNFQPDHIAQVMEIGSVMPAVNQIELHPYLTQGVLRKFHAELGIQTEAWSPLGHGLILSEPLIVSLAKKYCRTPAQVVLRWHLQAGTVVIPKATEQGRIRENLDVFHFELEAADIMAIDGLNRDQRTGPHPDTFHGT